MKSLELHYSRFRFNDDEFYWFCRKNKEQRYERDANGVATAVPYVGGNTGIQYANIGFQLQQWNKEHKLGLVFSSSTTFRLSSSAMRMAVATFVSHERWEPLTDKEQEQFPPLCPDFVIELMRNAARSGSDSLKDAKARMQNDWMDNGCQSGWLIDPFNQTIYIYRADGSIQINRSFEQLLSGEDVLPGLEFDLSELVA